MSQVNDLDKCTVISMCPFAVNEMKPGMFPSYYVIPKAKEGDFELLQVADAFYIQPIPATNQTIKVPVRATEIARSIVNDYIQGVLGYKEGRHPGLFWVRGVYDKSQIKSEYKPQLDQARSYQREWFLELVRLADDDWSQWKQHKFINENQRHAAQVLGLERDWLIVPTAAENSALNAPTKLCPACKTMVHIDAIICGHCRCILDSKKHSEMKFAVA